MTIFIGVDWSESKHQVNIYNQKGAEQARFTINQTLSGYAQLDKRVATFEPDRSQCVVGIETSHNLIVDHLVKQGYRVYVIAPSVVKSNRGRQGNSGAKDDGRDAELLADILRTDRQRLLPWRPHSHEIEQLRIYLSWMDDLTSNGIQTHNRLRSLLIRYYPQATTAFKDLMRRVILNFLIQYPTPEQAQAVTLEEFTTLCREHKYYQRKRYPEHLSKLQALSPETNPYLVPVYAEQVQHLAQQILDIKEQKRVTLKRILDIFDHHPDAHIFRSLPGAGDLLAPKLLVMFGDDRERLPHRAILPCIAGTVPVTKQSGKYNSVHFRRGCNHVFRQTIHLFARCSLADSLWAHSYFLQLLDRGKSETHALRCLGNRWLHIIWSLWQKGVPYDPLYHQQQVHRHRRPL